MIAKLSGFAVSTVLALGLLAVQPAAQEVPTQAPPAKQMLDAALTTAASTGKHVFVHFSASWCGWCHKLEAFLKTPDGESLLKYAIDVQLIVLESKGKELFENPGGAAMMKDWGGTGGIPFYVFLDAKGNVLSDANNMPDGTNIGYPANPVEVKAFDDVVARGVPKLPADIRAKIMKYISEHP